MPKMKTKSAAAKRFKVTKNRKVRYKKSHLRHILTSKTPKSKRHKRKDGTLSTGDRDKILRTLPYSY